MNQSWKRRLSRILDSVVELIIVCQDIQLDAQFIDITPLINNDAKLTLTLIEDKGMIYCNISLIAIHKRIEDELKKKNISEEKQAIRTENIVKSVLLKSLKCNDVLLLCKALRSVGLFAKKTNFMDKGFMKIAIDVHLLSLTIFIRE